MLSFKAPGISRLLEWMPFISSKDWMEKHMRLVKGRTLGAFDASKMPHSERIFDEIDKLSVNTIVLMTASQTIKTTIGISSILKFMDTDPNDALIMFPRESELTKMHINKVKPALDGCARIQEKIAVSEQDEKKKSRAFSLNIAGFILNILATNNTKSVSTKYNYYDEVVEFAIGKLSEAMERAKSFNGSGEKFIITSTQHPTRGGDDEINDRFNNCELKLQYWMCCSHCEKHYYPEREHLIYPSEATWREEQGLEDDYDIGRNAKIGLYAAEASRRTTLKCPHCEKEMDNKQRRVQILEKKCKWFAVEPVEEKITEEGIIEEWRVVEEVRDDYRSVGFDVNTLCIQSYDMGDIVKQIVEAQYAKSKTALMQMIYVGYFNRIFKTNIMKRQHSDILMLTNGLESWLVPDGTAKLYFLIDTQKDHYWWQVMAVQWGRKYNIIAHGRADEELQLEELMFRSYKTESGQNMYVDRAYIDMRGYQRQEQKDEDGNVTQTRVNTTERIREYVIQTNIKARQNGFIKQDEFFLWGTMGKEKLRVSDKELKESTERGEVMVGEPYTVKTMENKENPDFTYKVMYISNLAVKTELALAISNNIDNFKSIEEGNEPQYTTDLLFISEEMRQEGLARKRSRETDLEMMLTSEVYDHDVRDGKMKPYKTFFPIRKRNDQWDNAATGVCASMYDNIGVGEQASVTIGSGMSMFKKAFKK